jgi:hypothetical protein
MFLLESLVAFSIMIWTQPSPANEGAPPPSEASKPEASENSTTADEWIELSNRVVILKAKVTARNESLHHLIEEKQIEKNPQRVAEIIKQLNDEHQLLQKETKEYNQQSSILKFRFPEKAMTGSKRKYERITIDSLEQIETQHSLEIKIKKAVARTQKQFPSTQNDGKAFLDNSESPSNGKLPGDPHKSKGLSPSDPSIYLTEPVVVEK